MTKDDFGARLAAFLKIIFPKANDEAHSQMDAISLDIGQWIEELIDTRLDEKLRSMNLVDITLTEKHHKALDEPIETIGGWGDSSPSPPGSGRKDARFIWPKRPDGTNMAMGEWNDKVK